MAKFELIVQGPQIGLDSPGHEVTIFDADSWDKAVFAAGVHVNARCASGSRIVCLADLTNGGPLKGE